MGPKKKLPEKTQRYPRIKIRYMKRGRNLFLLHGFRGVCVEARLLHIIYRWGHGIGLLPADASTPRAFCTLRIPPGGGGSPSFQWTCWNGIAMEASDRGLLNSSLVGWAIRVSCINWENLWFSQFLGGEWWVVSGGCNCIEMHLNATGLPLKCHSNKFIGMNLNENGLPLECHSNKFITLECI